MPDDAGGQGDVAAVILAAGRASRFGAGPDTSKVVAALNGPPLIAHAVAAAQASRASPVLVVIGHAAAAVSAALVEIPGVILVENSGYLSGLASSLQVGLAALAPSVDGALIMLGDMPLVTSVTLDRLIETFQRERPEAVVPVCRGEQGNPVLIGRALFPAIMTLSGDQGARRLFGTARRIVKCPVEDTGVLTDVDTEAALEALSAPR